jgi:phosphoenolpyruvate---glycerone phosphotransferase subunit DhaL
MKTIPLTDIERAVQVIADTAIENENYFSELDGKCGDGDFGTSLATGFRVVQKDWTSLDRSSVGAFFSRVGIIITSNVGGCSGPLWGTAFIRAAALSRDKKGLTVEQLAAMLRSAIEGIKTRGGANLGDKTILDALDPVATVLEEWSKREDPSPGPELLQKATGAAQAMAEKSRPWTAKRGRQSFTGDRSNGTLDPGIVAIGTLLKALSDAFTTANKL